MIQVPATTPLLTNAEAAVWLRLCEADGTPGQLDKAVRKLHGLVRDRKRRPLASSTPYAVALAELHRHVLGDTGALSPRLLAAYAMGTGGRGRRAPRDRGKRADSHNGSNKETQN